MPETKPPIYIASPLGFTLAGRRYNTEVLLPAVQDAAFEPLDPWEGQPFIPRTIPESQTDLYALDALRSSNLSAGRHNAELIRRSAGVLAVLDGYDVDSGTAAEIGYATALRIPVVGVRSDSRLSGDNQATLVNLQVEWFIHESGGCLTPSLQAALQELRLRHLR
jgi:nucleoside 2-deoxyribosyltransferase